MTKDPLDQIWLITTLVVAGIFLIAPKWALKKGGTSPNGLRIAGLVYALIVVLEFSLEPRHI